MSTNYMLVCHECKVQTDLVIRSTISVRWTLGEHTIDGLEAFLSEHVVDHPEKLAVVSEHDDAVADYEDQSKED